MFQHSDAVAHHLRLKGLCLLKMSASSLADSLAWADETLPMARAAERALPKAPT
jgi:hypothetical protein